MTIENISRSNLHERMLPTRWGSNPQPPDHQSNEHSPEPPRPAEIQEHYGLVTHRLMQHTCMYTHTLGNFFFILNPLLTLEVLSKIVADDILKLILLVFKKKIRLDISCELSALQTIHMICQALFSLKNKRMYFKVSSAVVVISISRINYYKPSYLIALWSTGRDLGLS